MDNRKYLTMITTTNTNRTAEAIRQALEENFNSNRRRQVFQAVAEIGGTGLIIAPESDEITEDRSYKGFCGIQKKYFFSVPGYAERVCRNLANIMSINN